MERISDQQLNAMINNEAYSIAWNKEKNQDAKAHERQYSILQELKECRKADNKIAENIKKEMVIFCKNFEDRRNHSTICHPPDDEECMMLSFCESTENVLESVPTRKENLLVAPLDIKGQLRLMRDKCPDLWRVCWAFKCPKGAMNNYNAVECQINDTNETCDMSVSTFSIDLVSRCWDKALEGDE